MFAETELGRRNTRAKMDQMKAYHICKRTYMHMFWHGFGLGPMFLCIGFIRIMKRVYFWSHIIILMNLVYKTNRPNLYPLLIHLGPMFLCIGDVKIMTSVHFWPHIIILMNLIYKTNGPNLYPCLRKNFYMILKK